MIELVLPRPPSVNATRRYDWANHDSYKAWRTEAGLRLNRQHPAHVPGPVRIDIAIEDAGKGDLDNCAKQAIDLLVGHGVIEQDNRHVVREIHMSWDAKLTGCRVRVESIEATQPGFQKLGDVANRVVENLTRARKRSA